MMRWKKRPRPKGLAGVCAGPQGSELRDGEMKYASTGYVDARYRGRGGSGWYWVASHHGTGITHKNTCDTPVADEANAKAEAMAYVKAELKRLAAPQPQEQS